MTNKKQIQLLLAEPFPLNYHEVKPGAGGNQGQVLALPFVGWHCYQARLDQVVGWDQWSVGYRLLDQDIVLCELTILGVTKADCGELEEDEAPKQGQPPQKRRGANPLFGGVAQAFRRACASFGLGRYLYELDRYYAQSNGKQIAENPVDIIYKLLDKAGLAPMQRFSKRIKLATSAEELDAIRGQIVAFSEAGDFTEAEKKDLRQLYTERRSALITGKSAEPKAPTQPTTPAPSAPNSPPSEPTERDVLGEAITEKKQKFFDDYKKQIAEIEQGTNASDLMFKTLRVAIGDGPKFGTLTVPMVAELFDLLRQKSKPAPKSSLAAAPTEAKPEIFDDAEVKVKGESSEAREASLGAQIEGLSDTKVLDAIGKEIEKDRLLMSSAVDRLKKKISARRARVAIETAPRQSHGVESQEVLRWKGKIRSAKTENELDQFVSEASIANLSMKELDAIDLVVIERRAVIKTATKAMQDLQVAPLF